MRQSRLGKPKDPPVKTVTLWAPACTVAFAKQYYGMSFEHHLVNPKGFRIDLLSDDYERDDHVILEAIYGKSVLYLISRALEDVHKSPLLGLERSIPGKWKKAIKEDFFAQASGADLEAWNDVVKKYKLSKPNVLRSRDAGTAAHIVPPSHTTFDNDVDINNTMLRRILGKRPQHLIKNLSGLDASNSTV